MSELVRYDAMCAAIDAAYEVDEVKDIRDKALAIEVYTRQAQNIEAERKAVQIRLRAERKAGELLRDREKAKGAAEPGTGRGTTRSSDTTASPKTLAELGISKGQNSQWQKLAAVPKDDFEAELAIEVYTRQAQNIEAERKAVQIRLRAERKAGELLRDREKAKGNQYVNSARSNGTTEQKKTLAELGISKDQSSQWQKLAAVPKEEFEAVLTGPDIPTTAGIIAKASRSANPAGGRR